MKSGKITLWNKTIQNLLVSEKIDSLRLAVALLGDDKLFVYWAWGKEGVSKLNLPVCRNHCNIDLGKRTWGLNDIKEDLNHKYWDGSGTRIPLEVLTQAKQEYDDNRMEQMGASPNKND